MGAQDYLDQAIGWARQTGLQVVIDLHGVAMYLRNAGNGADEPSCSQARNARKTASTTPASPSVSQDGRRATLSPPLRV
jgi:aryl-phospho-beta-D-glucosidase BglC (GH1 family)